MKHFLFIVHRWRNKENHPHGTVTLYQVKRNIPVQLGTYDFTFEDDNQAAWNCAEKCKALPKRYFNERTAEARNKIWDSVNVREKGIATFHQL